MNLGEQRRAAIGNKSLGYILIAVPLLAVASCIAAVWDADFIGILMSASFVASCAVAVWASYFRRHSGDPDPLDWYWPAQFPFVHGLLLVPSLVAAWWSWWGRAAAIASLAAIAYWSLRMSRLARRAEHERRVARERDRG